MSAPAPPPEEIGARPRQIPPGVPQNEQAASGNIDSIGRAYAEYEALTRNASPEDLQKDADFREHGRNQRFRHQFELIAICALWIAAAAIAGVGGVWLWHMAAPDRWRWLKSDDVSHLQSIMTAGLLVGVIGNHFKKRMG